MRDRGRPPARTRRPPHRIAASPTDGGPSVATMQVASEPLERPTGVGRRPCGDSWLFWGACEKLPPGIARSGTQTGRATA